MARRHRPEPNWDDPQVWAYLVDRKMLWLSGPVRPIIGLPGTVVVGDTNGDVQWLLGSMDRHNPCGGGQASVDKDADRRRWDHPY